MKPSDFPHRLILRAFLLPFFLEVIFWTMTLTTVYAPGETFIGNLPYIGLPLAFQLLTLIMVLPIFLLKHIGRRFRLTLLAWVVCNIAISIYVGQDVTPGGGPVAIMGFLGFVRALFCMTLLVITYLWHRKMLSMERAAKKLTPTPQAQT